MSGSDGSTSPPTHETTQRAVKVSSAPVVRAQVPFSSSKRASTISVSSRRWERSCHFSTRPRRYLWISPDSANRRLQAGVCSNESEYTWEGTSQAAPG
jgi:hypothetical protein